jgi:hypothetical protein
VVALFGIDLALGCLYWLDWLLGAPSVKLHAWLNIEAEGTIATWYSSLQLFAIAVLLALFAARLRARGDADAPIIFAGSLLFALLSADEVIMIHEYLGYRLYPPEMREGSPFHVVGIWGFVLGPLLLAVMAWGRWRARRLLHGLARVSRRFAAGGILFVISAALVDEGLNLVTIGGPVHALEVILEEVGEMAGVTLMLWATWDLLAAHGLSLRLEDPLRVPPRSGSAGRLEAVAPRTSFRQRKLAPARD